MLRALLRSIVDHAHCDGLDSFGRPVCRFEFAGQKWQLDKLAALGVEEEDEPAEEDDPKEDIDAVLA